MAKNKREERIYYLEIRLDTVTTNKFMVDIVEGALFMLAESLKTAYTKGQTKVEAQLLDKYRFPINRKPTPESEGE